MAGSLLCARPGCRGFVAAWLTYDYTTQRVWLDDEPSAAGNQWALCAEHAGRLRPPRGWEQVDRRRGAPGWSAGGEDLAGEEGLTGGEHGGFGEDLEAGSRLGARRA
ncbi:MAG: DUF3499 family protein [Acidimicrobiaceae bacterium]|nr:DUF3499 family protein [Acidimicrobiaceae bacterium]MBO0746780.1 DUF3499 family protein [Acidimicrobiaceae bacterium]